MSLLSLISISYGLNPSQVRFVSSAKRFALVVSKQLGRSLMYNRNKIGPRLEPWGTPHFSCLTDDTLLFTEHIWFRPERYDSNHFELQSRKKPSATLVTFYQNCQKHVINLKKSPLAPLNQC